MASKPPKGSKTPPRAQPGPSANGGPDPIDVGEVARAVSAGFLILVFGGLIQPVVTAFVPVVGVIWLILVAVAAFSVAGARVGRTAPNPPLHGSGAAMLSYVLVVPLLFINGTFDPLYAVCTFVAAAIVGALAGYIGARMTHGS